MRVPDWPRRLSALMLARQDVPFAWGLNDCASFAADAAQALRGVDVLAELRGERRTALAARRQIEAGGGIPAALARAGLAEVPPALAQRGDLLWLAQGEDHVLAVCWGELAAAPGPQGLGFASMDGAVRAWRV
ncbi:MAG: DUF6950 family protein [Roseateles sp.]